ncbi:MAG: glycosyl transferase family protein, partial [Polaromonas sp.]|nr:glycosyl transferase family protein [Polaromonas sp.]
SRRVAWDKTSHQLPSLGGPGRARRALGRILVEQGVLSERQLDVAREQPVRGLRLGSQLVHEGVITAEQLAEAVAEQAQVLWERLDGLAIAPTLLAKLPGKIALHYAVLPIREEGETLVLASESVVDPVSLAALGRKLARPVRYVIVPKGQVVVGLRHWYARHRTPSGRALLDRVVASRCLSAADAESIWQEFVSRQVLLGEVLQALGRVEAAALGAVLLRQERSGLSLGKFLVKEGLITRAVLDEVLQLQGQHQVSMCTLLQRAGGQPRRQIDLKKVNGS